MSVLAPGVRDRSFKKVLRGFDPQAVRAALAAAATAFEALEAEVARLREQQADAVREMDRMGELERSLLRSCVAAEEDARVRCGAARRYATRMIAAAEEQAAARLDAPTRERDRIARDIDTMMGLRRHAAEALDALIAGLQHAPEIAAVQERHDEVDGEALPPHDTIAAEAATAPGDVSLAGEPRVVDHPEIDASLAGAERTAPLPRKLVAVASMPVGRRGSEPAAGERVAAAAAGVAVGMQTPRTERSRGRRLRVPFAAGSAAALLLVLHGSAVAPRVNRTPPAVAASFAAVPVDAEPPAPQDPAMAPGTGSSAPAPPEAPAPAAGLTIHIKPLRTCWVRVVVDGRTDARELQPGEDVRLTAQRSIVLRAGDAGALSIELNGRVLPPLGLDGQVVERRFTAPAAP